MRLVPISLLIGTGILAPSLAGAQKLQLDGFLGSSASVPLPITISQAGERDLHFTAHWETKPRSATWYYAIRIGLWKGNKGWMLDHTHHKLYLTNPPTEVQYLRVTNGFNIFSLSRAFRRGKLTYSFGAGPVITVPYNSVRGKVSDGGYGLSGASLRAGATRRFPLIGGFTFNLDARVTAAYVRLPVVDGHASMPNLAGHLLFGLGLAP